MTLRLAEAVTITALLLIIAGPDTTAALGSASTIAVSPSSSTVCAVVAAAGDSPRSIRCTLPNSTSSFPILPNASFQSLSGGDRFLCGLRSAGPEPGSTFFCWTSDNLIRKRVYSGPVTLSDLTVGADHVAAFDANGSAVRFWRGDGSFPAAVTGIYRSLTSGNGFTCGIDGVSKAVRCWGRSGGRIETAFANTSMSYISAGGSHVCGLDAAGALVCRGDNSSGQSNAPNAGLGFSGLALGGAHTCAIRRSDKSVLCWGGAGTGGEFTPVNDTQFELLAAGGDMTCGVTTLNFSVVCWRADPSNLSVRVLPLPKVLPGICVKQEESKCSCGVFPDSASLCSGSGVICSSCPSPSPKVPSPAPAQAAKKSTSKWRLVSAIVGGVGIFVGVCSIIYCLWTGLCRQKKVYNSVQPTITAAGNGLPNPPVRRSPMNSPSGSRSRIFGRQGSRVMRRQRSGPSSFKDRAEQFSLSELAAATENFKPENKIGAGSFGTVYKGKLPDGREVAIKRSGSETKTRKIQDKESAFQSELAFLSRLHHKHLVGLVGFCDEEEERLLVYDYMKNGALYDHLHSSKHPDSRVVKSWKTRIRVLLDASRGIEYLHNYAVPPIIHRDIKSSNILLDANWVARVSDFGLSLMGPDSKGDHLTMRAAGTVGYMDPEYYGLHHLTEKSDVYGLGVVMLEVLTGKRAIFRSRDTEDGHGGDPVSVVDYAVPSIVAGEVAKVLDERAGALGPSEAEAVELVAYTAVHCVSLEGKERPSMTDIVSNLESALALCEDSHGSISSASFSLASFD
ncbi:putative serine/threonine-protein kinase-like protein CCR3 [Iris pallida]|uniref:Serine/threonine-protein kinase-like protein CCR3 n=2 Tax=Iris pallida TaxID=29817 RepID=A0AAX6EFB1_IRIPA|nr:putative serine/threonine-protein kinase-like protein CCR3 [Iris pallida]